MRIGRNDPCWCGSGHKYKKCHLPTAIQPVPPDYKDFEADRNSRDQLCLHPGGSTGGCSGKIVKAHTIQRNGGLSRIARSGHVLMGPQTLEQVFKAKGQYRLAPVGVARATTFTGFCELHDRSTFAPLETRPYAASEETSFLLAYRALCRELYAKRYAARLDALTMAGGSGRSRDLDADARLKVDGFMTGVAMGNQDLVVYKQRYDKVLTCGDFSDTRFVAFILDGAPPLMAGGGCYPYNDFMGGTLHTGDDLMSRRGLLEFVTFSMIGTDTGGVAVFAWLGDQPHCIQLVRSLMAQTLLRVPDALIRYAVEMFENIAVSPSWWDGLTAGERAAFERRAGPSPFEEPKPNRLVDDGARIAPMAVVDVRSNLAI